MSAGIIPAPTSDCRLLEFVFNRYKNDECLDRTNVQGNFPVLGNEFVNYISTVAGKAYTLNVRDLCSQARKANIDF